MRSRLNWVLVCAAVLASGWGCSGDNDDALSTRFETQPNQGGSAGSSSQTGSSAPSTSTGGTSSSEGGGAAPGLTGNGASGESRERDAGLEPVRPGDAGASDAGQGQPEDPVAEPDAEAPPPPPPPPPQDSVAFGEVFPVLVASCGGCHGATAGNRPAFAVAGNEAASFTATQGMSRGEAVSARIVARAVTTRDMPPACRGGALGTGSCLDAAEAALLQAWVAQGAQR